MADGRASRSADDPTRTHAATSTGSAPNPSQLSPNWPRWFCLIGALLGLVYVVSMPVGRPLDEPAHLARVITMNRGVIVPPGFGEVDTRYQVDGCTRALIAKSTANFRALLDDQPQPLSRAERWRMHFVNPPCTDAEQLVGGGTISNAEINSPVPYLPAMVGWAIGRPVGGALGGLYGARLVQLVAYLAICWWALRRLPWGRPFAATVALLPTTLAGAAGVSADPMTFALTFATIATTLGIIADTERAGGRPVETRRLVALTVLLILLSLCKPGAAPLVLLAIIVPAGAFVSVRRRVAWIGATFTAVAATGGMWALTVASKVHITTTPHVDSIATGQWLSHHLWSLPAAVARTLAISDASRYLLGGVVTPLGIDMLEVPVILTLIGVAVIIVARLVDPLPDRYAHVGSPGSTPARRPRKGRRKGRPTRQIQIERVTAALIACAGVAAVSYGIYLASNRPGSSVISGIQGRYFLPYLLLILVGCRPTTAGTARVGYHRFLAAAIVSLNVIWIAMLLVWWQLI